MRSNFKLPACINKDKIWLTNYNYPQAEHSSKFQETIEMAVKCRCYPSCLVFYVLAREAPLMHSFTHLQQLIPQKVQPVDH